MNMMDQETCKKLQKAGYKIVGNHSAVKLCLWTRKSIKSGEKEFCYKEKFYKNIGIKSHGCMQMTPSFPFCTLRCAFCWRDTTITYPKWVGNVDEPEEIADKCIDAQRGLLSGLGGVPHSEEHLKEAMNPSNVAISLAGEPTFYDKLSQLIGIFHKRNMKTFLVTNGTLPERLENLETLPTQLYISLCSNGKEMMEKVQRPLIPDAWERLNKSLEMLPNLKTRKVIRLTMVKNFNMSEPEKYAKLIERALPDFVEIKAGMAVGFARLQNRIRYEDMASHEEIKVFTEKISDSIGYKITDEKKDSRVVLLVR
ncbi:tRNA-modifying enzyme [Candidatus Micrarchaeota archaeon RBG_16_36_9]|nr:MAG: tRNA-modifying enzyme [Candidatus Micrarchaeota archaeon RBG_16_36_9]